MGLRDKFKKKHGSDDDDGSTGPSNHPEFTFIRTDTHGVEVLQPPSAGPHHGPGQFLSAEPRAESKQRRSLDVFRSSRSRSASESSNQGSATKRLSQRLHLSRSPVSSENVPQDLPDIVVRNSVDDKDGAESQWEKRATMLARENEKHRSRPGTPVHGSSPPSIPRLRLGDASGDESADSKGGVVSTKAIDDDIQEAIRLHEEGKLEESTRLFGRLADPKGANNPLSQVLYGLALRYVPLAPPERHMGVMQGRHAGAGRVPRRNAPNGRRVGHAVVGLPNNGGRHKLTTNPGTGGVASRIPPRPSTTSRQPRPMPPTSNTSRCRPGSRRAVPLRASSFWPSLNWPIASVTAGGSPRIQLLRSRWVVLVPAP
jgi:hypothetical protein